MARPESVTNIWVTSANALFVIGLLLWLNSQHVDPMIVLKICLSAIAIPICLHDIAFRKINCPNSVELDEACYESFTNRLKRVFVKLIGLGFTIAICATGYWALPEYSGYFYDPYFDFIFDIMPFFGILAVLYFFFTDRHMPDPYDGYWVAGRICLGRFPSNAKEREALRTHFLGWAIKWFFLPLMFVYLHGNIIWFQENDFETSFSSNMFMWWLRITFFADVAYATVGYLLTIRLFDSHIRSVNPFALCWIVTIICYQPFWSLIERQYLNYLGGYSWEIWLSGDSLLSIFWGMSLLILMMIYAWSTVVFGIRFSNLTHRGIITNGPYALTKHPAYIAKNLFWWIAALPVFLSNNWDFAIKGSLLLGMVSYIYFLRAKYEEKHLAEDRTYREYAEWVKVNGVIGLLRRCLANLYARLVNGRPVREQ